MITSQLPNYLVNTNAKLRTVIDPRNTFIFDELTPETLDEFVHDGSYFNRQNLGLTVREFIKHEEINKRY